MLYLLGAGWLFENQDMSIYIKVQGGLYANCILQAGDLGVSHTYWLEGRCSRTLSLLKPEPGLGQ